MSWIKYKYTCKIVANDYRCNFPNIELELSNAGETIKTQGLIDSGSEITIVHSDFAEALGINLSKCKKMSIGGVNGSSEAYIAECFMYIKDHGGKFKTEVKVMDDLPVPVLLGQEGFFEFFKIKFEKARGTFEISRENM